MEIRRLFALITVLVLISSFSLSAFATEWNLAQQGDFKITSNGDYSITSTDKNNKPVSTNNSIIISDNVKATITLNNVDIASKDAYGIQLGSGADVTLNLVGDNKIFNTSDSKPSIKNDSSNLVITSVSGGTLKLMENIPQTEVHSVTIDLSTIMNGGNFVVVKDSNSNSYMVVNDENSPTETIADEPVPLAPSADIMSNITVSGNAQLVTGQDIYPKNCSYVIGMDTIINGIHGWDLEALADHVPYHKDYSNLIFVTSSQQLKNCRVLNNKGKNISVIVSDESKSIKLTESKLKNKQLIDGIDTKSILSSCNLNLGKNYTNPFVIRFHLDKAYAGQTVELRTIENDKVVTKNVIVSESGIAAFEASVSGDFALVSK
jgi:hypothetical protein